MHFHLAASINAETGIVLILIAIDKIIKIISILYFFTLVLFF